MEVMSLLPGRIRLKNPLIYFNKPLARYINAYIHQLYGVTNSKVNHVTSSMIIEYDLNKTNHQLLQKNIEHAIHSAIRQKPKVLQQYQDFCQIIEKRDKAKRNFLFYGLLYLLFKGKQSLYGKFAISRNLRVLQLASAVTIVGGYPLLKGLYRRFTKNVPAYSDILLKLTAISSTIMRESSKGVFVLVLKQLNDYIRYSAEVDCHRMLQQSMNKTVGMAWFYQSDQPEVLVTVNQLTLGQMICVHKGEIVPVHGEVVEGQAIVDNLYHTGQSMVSHIGKKSKVFEGMTVIVGEIRVKVTQLPLTASKPDRDEKELEIYKKVSRYRQHIAPVAIGAGVLSSLVTGNILNGLSVLLVLCPSASGTALSSGIKSYVSCLRKHKIYLKNPNTLEKTVGINHVIFDKTGTLTYGQMKIKDVISFDHNYSRCQLIKLSAACEADQYHPIAVTIKEESKEYDTDQVQSSVLLSSKGVKAIYSGQEVLIGNKKLMLDNHIDLAPGLKKYEEYENMFYTPIFISVDGRLVGLMALMDVLREDAGKMVDKLRYWGVNRISMLTGDRREKAQYTGGMLGIDNIYSYCSHEDKMEVIRQNKKADTVMMVGDGINDVLAMKEADVSVSFVDGCCDKVKLHSDCLIFEDKMEHLADFIWLSQRSYRYIRQSIIYSKMHNMILGILALMGRMDAFTAKSLNTVNSLIVLLLNKRIEYL